MDKGKITSGRIAADALFAALGLITFLIESLFPPLFIPGAKMGLSNIFSLSALVLYGPVDAFVVVAVRTLLGSLFAGNISALLYSFTGGMAAMLVSATALVFSYMPYLALIGVLSGAIVGAAVLIIFKKVPLSVYEKAINGRGKSSF